METISRRQLLLNGLAAAVALAFPEPALAAESRKPKTRKKTKPKNKYATTNPRNDSQEVLLARMLYGEARASYITDKERIAIGYVAINRKNDSENRWGKNLTDVILAPKQYSCFNPNDPNRRVVLDPESDDSKTFYHLLDLSKKILKGEFEDPAKANHYHERSLKRPNWPEKYLPISCETAKDGLILVGESKEGDPIYSRHKFYTG